MVEFFEKEILSGEGVHMRLISDRFECTNAFPPKLTVIINYLTY